MLKDQVDVSIVVGLDDIVQAYNVGMFAELLQENNLSVGSLKTAKKSSS